MSPGDVSPRGSLREFGKRHRSSVGAAIPTSEEIAVPAVPIERHALKNGLRVILSRDAKAPIVAVNLWYDVGSKHEEAGKTGFAHLFEHMMFAATAHVPRGPPLPLVGPKAIDWI